MPGLPLRELVGHAGSATKGLVSLAMGLPLRELVSLAMPGLPLRELVSLAMPGLPLRELVSLVSYAGSATKGVS